MPSEYLSDVEVHHIHNSFVHDLTAKKILQLLDHAKNAIGEDEDKARSHIAEALALLANDHPHILHQTQPQPKLSGLAPWQQRIVKAHIEAHLDEPIQIGDVASLSRLSRSYFSVAFRRSFGLSFHKFLIRLRIDRSKTMMASTGCSLAEISSTCGFSDQAHFCRLFRQNVGTSPKRWRRQHVSSSAAVVLCYASDRPTVN